MTAEIAQDKAISAIEAEVGRQGREIGISVEFSAQDPTQSLSSRLGTHPSPMDAAKASLAVTSKSPQNGKSALNGLSTERDDARSNLQNKDQQEKSLVGEIVGGLVVGLTFAVAITGLTWGLAPAISLVAISTGVGIVGIAIGREIGSRVGISLGLP